MKIGIQIKNQNITTEKTRCIVANSVNFVTGVCSFDEEWDGLAKHIIFTNGEVSKELIITQGTDFVVPYEVLVPGELEVSVVGYGENGEKRLTTKKMSMPLLVYESGDVTGDKSEGYTPEIWEQIAAVIGNIADIAVDADTLVEAINAIVNAVDTDGVVLQKDDSGFFQTTEEKDGAAIYYLHDKKSLEQSQNIIKLSDNMLEFSKDGGKSYLYELAVNNDVLPEILAKIENHTESFENPHNVTASQIGAVPKERKINGKTLKEDVVLTAEELDAVPADRKINGKALSGDIMLEAEDFDAVPVSRKVNGKPLDEDITLTAADVGAEISGTIQESIEKHNTAILAHSDIRILVEEIADDIKTLTDNDAVSSDKLAELLEGVEKNRELIDAVSAEKLDISDVVNDLVTVDANKPLSAAQGVEIKMLINGVGEHAENKENPHAVTIGQIGAAPAGYGLGAACENIKDWNNATENGFYIGNVNTPDGGWWWGYVVKNSEDYIDQRVFSNHSMKMIEAHRQKYAGVWQPWEWVNPPMFIGVEYRTTERYIGKPVYTMVVSCGALPTASTAKAVEHRAENVFYVLSCSAQTYQSLGTEQTFPYTRYPDYPTSSMLYCDANRTSVTIGQVGDIFNASYYVYAVIRYTKTTD